MKESFICRVNCNWELPIGLTLLYSSIIKVVYTWLPQTMVLDFPLAPPVHIGEQEEQGHPNICLVAILNF